MVGEGGIDWSARRMFHARNAMTKGVRSLERGHGDIRVDAAVFLEEDEAKVRRASRSGSSTSLGLARLERSPFCVWWAGPSVEWSQPAWAIEASLTAAREACESGKQDMDMAFH